MKNFFSRAANGFVSLPDPVKAGVTAVVLWLVSTLFTNAVLLLPFLSFLIPFASPIALAVAAAMIGWFERIIPDAWGAVAVYAVQLVLAILAVLGIGQQLAAQGLLPALLH